GRESLRGRETSASLLLHQASAVAADNRRGVSGQNRRCVGVRSVHQDLDGSSAASLDVAGKSRQDVHDDVRLSSVEQFLNFSIIEWHGDQLKSPRTLKSGQKLTALRRIIAVEPHHPAVLDIQVHRVPEDQELDQGRKE